MTPAIEPNRIKWIYGVAAMMALFTGLGNMPLYGRYYLADLPGLRWTGNFIVNVSVHYIFGAVLVALGIYFLTLYLLLRRHGWRLSRPGTAQAVALILVLSSGVIMAVKNFSGVAFALPLLIGLNLYHLGSAMLFAAVALGVLILKKPWFRLTGA
jgi:membrane-associated PAP2 superfamily phosphatase